MEVPESGVGPLSDQVIWLDNTTFLHYQNFGTIHIWQIDEESDPLLYLYKALPVDISSEIRVLLPVGNHLRFYSFYPPGSLFDLNLETGELI